MSGDESNAGVVQSDDGVRFNRVWAMPDSSTFDIRPIRKIVHREMNRSDGLWIDPFSGGSPLADVTNDLNPEIESGRSMDAVDFLQEFSDGEVDGGVLFDPPYSPRQIKEVYDNVGLETYRETTQSTFWTDVKDQIARVCHSGATVVTCAWNSGGVGTTRGFELRRILLVAHGGWHNDTVVTVEDRVRTGFQEFQSVAATDGGSW